MTILIGTIQKRHGTAAEWTTANPTLLQGEEGLETDARRTKTGNGIAAWDSLPYDDELTAGVSGLLTGGAVSVLTDDVTVAASTYYISGQGAYSAALTNFNNITLSSTGTQRYLGFYGNTSGVIVKVEGAESAIAAYPTTPADTAVIGFVLVTDAAYAPSGPGAVAFSDITGNASDNANLVAYVKRPRVQTVASSATPTINVDLYDIFYFSAQAHNITSITVTGTLTPFRPIILVFLDNGVARTITRGSSFVAVGETMVTTTTANKITTEAYLYYPSKSKLGCVGVKTEA